MRDGAALLLDDLHHHLEVGVEELDHPHGPERLGERRKALDVAHEHRCYCFHGLEVAAALEEPARHLLRDEAPERAAEKLALAQPLHHAVEGATRVVELGDRAAAQLRDIVELALFHRLRGQRQLLHRLA